MEDTYLEVFHKNLVEIWARAKQRIDNMKEKEIKRTNLKVLRMVQDVCVNCDRRYMD